MREVIWFLDPVARASFEAAARGHHAFFTSSFELLGGTWMYVLTLVVLVPTLGSRAVRILFTDEGTDAPIVHVFDPFWSPHRYSDGSLCMWHPHDPLLHRWLHTDGLPALIGHIQAHLVREDWWRRMGEWLGPEAPHSKAVA
jgi:hypothetical protein